MIEDENYRVSSQYRYWSFTKARLEEIRRDTNVAAAEKARAARGRAGDVTAASNSADLECRPLSMEEELLVVEMGCEKILEMGEIMEPRVPTNITATAIQYLRRFYLTNSPMTYHPKQITACALLLAMKADHFYGSRSNFVKTLHNITEDDVKASEFLLMQSLRFTLDVRHPIRGLEGGITDIHALVKRGHLGILTQQNGSRTQSTSQRVASVANNAQLLLLTAAQMTDAYFLYTPSQIWLGALFAIDGELATQYMEHFCSKIGTKGAVLCNKLLVIVRACAELLLSYRSADKDLQKKQEIRNVRRKLKNFRNMEIMDNATLTKAKAATKRELSGCITIEKASKMQKLDPIRSDEI